MEEIVLEALKNLDKLDYYDEYIDYLKSQWYYTVEDLKLAIDDNYSWSDLKLPGRCKLEIKNIILNKYESDVPFHMTESMEEANRLRTTSKSNDWVKYYSSQHDCVYYYNSKTNQASWELPTDVSKSEIEMADIDKSQETNQETNQETSQESESESWKEELKSPHSALDSLIQSFGPQQKHSNESDSFYDEPSNINNTYIHLFTVNLENLKSLDEMGFHRESSMEALRRSNNDLHLAVSILTGKQS